MSGLIKFVTTIIQYDLPVVCINSLFSCIKSLISFSLLCSQ